MGRRHDVSRTGTPPRSIASTRKRTRAAAGRSTRSIPIPAGHGGRGRLRQPGREHARLSGAGVARGSRTPTTTSPRRSTTRWGHRRRRTARPAARQRRQPASGRRRGSGQPTLPPAGITAADVLADPASFLQGASRFMFYDLGAFERGEGPPRSIRLEREQHCPRRRGDGAGRQPDPRRRSATSTASAAHPDEGRVDAGPAIQRDAAGSVVVDGDGQPVLARSRRALADQRSRWSSTTRAGSVRTYEPLFSTVPASRSTSAAQVRRRHAHPLRPGRRVDPPGSAERHLRHQSYTAWETRQLRRERQRRRLRLRGAAACAAAVDPERPR